MVLPIGSSVSEAISMKICANYMAISQIEIMGELYTFAEKSGLNLDILQMMFQAAFAESTLKMYAEKIKNRDFDEAGFDLMGGLKDFKIYEEAFTLITVFTYCLLPVYQTFQKLGPRQGIAAINKTIPKLTDPSLYLYQAFSSVNKESKH